ncbi:hypothetical protein GCM10025868_19600 [Angustibacter aerolatus]|uniref:Uncharacterized protein n=1 Tax=Angustibacter aerolatus TaxID=1162965 RepID=A0ABQ6JIR3_9ACTN|nr:hypothetical protein GCM10025868_19600 [Angustibacter aerolatus]
MRSAAHADGPVVAVLEREDEWFALVRADAGSSEDHRVFVSDLDAAERSQFAEPARPRARPRRRRLRCAASSGPQGHRRRGRRRAWWSWTTTRTTPPPSPTTTPWTRRRRGPATPACSRTSASAPASLVDLVVESVDDPGTVLADVGERCGFDDQARRAALR